MNILEKVKVKVSVFGHAKCNNIGFASKWHRFIKETCLRYWVKKTLFGFIHII